MIALCALGAGAAACSKSANPPPASTAPPAAAAAEISSASGSGIGQGPAPGSAGAVGVVLEPKIARTVPLTGEKPVMDQAGLTFGPELLLVRTGQPVEFRNSDDTLHNVRVSHEETHASSFNVAIPTGESYTYTFERDGFYRVGCDIHPAMAASIFAASTPYTTLADSTGAFSFADVAAGSWTLTVYVNGKTLRKDVAVTGGVTRISIE